MFLSKNAMSSTELTAMHCLAQTPQETQTHPTSM